MTDSRGEPVALAIRDHQTRLDDWPHANLARQLHHWVRIFDLEFKLQLPAYPVLRFACLRNAYGTYCSDRTDLGTKDDVTLNSRELERGAVHVLGTLCHELLHLWQQYHGKPSRGAYHNVEFRKKAADCGLVVDERGHQPGCTEVFMSVVAKYGASLALPPGEKVFQGAPVLWGARQRELKMKKWSCSCGINVRCAVKLDATCNRCGHVFRLA